MSKTAKKDVAASKTSLPRRLLFKAWLLWFWFAQSCYNYERMMGPDILHAMSVVIDKLYDKDDIEGRRKAMQRHTVFFNTTPSFGSMIIGISVAMEEKIAQGAKDIDDEAVNSMKLGLMGPLAGIGDSFNQGILLPLLLAMGISLGSQGNVAGPILYVILMVGIVFAIAYITFFQGYYKGKEAIVKMMENGVLKKILAGAGALGCMVMGALVAKYVSLSTTVEFAISSGTFNLQANVFDTLLPKLLPLLLTLGTYKLLSKGQSALRVMLYIVALGLVLGLLGII